jgi:putative FmdB family regulatory protein
MPTYEYECTRCGYQFEAFQKISDPAIEKCPECGKKVRRLISSGLGIIFKGSGFYSTDNKKSSYAADSAAASKNESNKKDAAGKAEKKNPDKQKQKSSA